MMVLEKAQADPIEGPLLERASSSPEARAAYASHLRERNDPRAELFDIADALEGAEQNERFKLVTRMDDILADVAMRAWWDAVCGVGAIQNCGHPAAQAFSFVCPRSWAGLAPTDSPNVRTCDLCRERVYLAKDLDALAEHAEAQHCVALPIAFERDTLEKAQREIMMVGRPKPISYLGSYALRHRS